MSNIKLVRCRDKHHVPNQSRKPKRFRDVCNSYVDESEIIKSRKNCPCCNGITTKKRKHCTAKIILNKALKETKDIITAYNLFPCNDIVGITVFVKHQHFTYSIPLPVLARYSEAFQNMNCGEMTDFWSEGMRNDSSFSKVLEYCEKRIKFVGLR